MSSDRSNPPHVRRNGKLKNGNPSGNLQAVARCGAKTRQHTPCRQPAMKNGRCRLHGGKSTGPKTPEGKARARRGNWKHGEYSAETKALHKKISELGRQSRKLLNELDAALK